MASVKQLVAKVLPGATLSKPCQKSEPSLLAPAGAGREEAGAASPVITLRAVVLGLLTITAMFYRNQYFWP